MDVWGDMSRLAIVLFVQSTPLHSVGQACRIKYSHIAAGSLGALHMSEIYPRDNHQYTDVDYFGFDESDLDPRLVLWPPTNDSLISDGLQA